MLECNLTDWWPSGSIPVLHVEGETIAEAWEKSLVRLYDHGGRAETQYDPNGAPPSIDATMMIVVTDPLKEPRIHKCFPGGLNDLQEYVMELVEGVKDHWVRDPNDPNDKRWSYTYHERLTRYPMPTVVGKVFRNQLDVIVDQLARAPHTRRANAVTWKVWEDLTIEDPPCLQSIWCRMVKDDRGAWRLNMNVRFRSRDAFKAAFMNMYALVELQKDLCARVQTLCGKCVLPGRYCEINDSYHIYGVDIESFKKTFLDTLRTRSFDDRCFHSVDVEPIMEEARAEVMEKIAKYDREHGRR